MTLHRFTLHPRSPWRTPWHADTLLGMLCATAARTQGAPFLNAHLIDPMREGQPPFVLSDACPADWLPLPLHLRLAPLPEGAAVKHIKRARWLSRDDFLAARNGSPPPHDRWLHDPFQTDLHRHNTLSRDNDTSLEEGGLFAREDVSWRPPSNQDRGATHVDTLSLYARVRDPGALDLLHHLLHELALTGFGADTSTGRGQFDLVGDPVPDPALDTPPPDPNAVICLSTFQPAPGDPADGCWETFPRFGKLGPDLGVAEVHKHTLILFRPGACFHVATQPPFLGRALPMDLVLTPQTAAELLKRDIHIIHPAFGLTLPARWTEPLTP